MTTSIDEVVEQRYADVGEVRLHYVMAGEGPLVVLLHGFPEFWYSWRHQIPALANAGYRVVVPDLRGYHLSDKPRRVSSYREEHYAADIAGLIAECEADSAAAVVGHDWGAAVAWGVALRHPELVDRLVVINGPYVPRYMHLLVRTRQFLKSWYAGLFQIPLLAEWWLTASDYAYLRKGIRWNRTPRGSLDPVDEARYVASWKTAGSITPMLNYYRAALRSALLRRAAPAGPFTKPALVIWGDLDSAMVPGQAEQAGPWAPEVTVHHVADAGHWVNEDKPEEVNPVLIEFLARA